uniref:Integrase catalytic domain-containing protein n=1 Tax=Tanacetum cinerariifolium TaxID=118510 RepID=A0A699HPS4_TANCI|nr:hypothetical protein [Tanacetum cinerariifolium]
MVYRYDGLLMHPPSPDYVPGPEHPPSLDYVPGPEYPPSPVYVPYVLEPAYPEFMPPEDDVFLAEEQTMPAAVSPTANSLGYITESDLEGDPKENNEDPKEDPADYPTDKDDDEEEEESSRDDVDDEVEDEDEEEEKHLAPADSVLPPAYCTTTRMSFQAQTSIPILSEIEVARLLAIPTLLPSPLTPYSLPLPHIPSLPLPASPTHPLGYRAAMIRLRSESPFTSHPLPLPLSIVLPHTRESMAMMRADTPSTYILVPRSETPLSETLPLLHIPLPTSSPPLLLPSTDHRADVPKVTLLPRKRLCIAIGPRFEVEECSSTPTARPTGIFIADYGFVGTLDAEIRHDPDREIGYKIADDDRLLMSSQLNSLRKDRHSHSRTARLIESEARASGGAWVQSMDTSDMACSKVRALQTTVLAQQTEIEELRAANRRRQTQLTEALNILKTLQTQMLALQSQQRPARDPAHLYMAEDKSEEKRLEDVPTVQDFFEVFLEDLSGLPLTRQVEFHIDLIHGAAPVAQVPYRFAMNEMKELSDQLKELFDKGFIRPSSSPWGAPVLFVKKNDGSFRMNKKEHEENLKEILELDKKDELYAKFSKCEFWIPKIAKSMTKLTQKEVKFDWGDKEEAAFQLIKQKLCSAPILALPKGSKDFMVYYDASYKGLGAILMQKEKKSLQKVLGTNLDMSTAYHSQTNGQSWRIIQTLEDMLRAYVIDFGKVWVNHLPLVEFSYNNSYHASIKAAPFEALYGRKCRSPVCWAEVGEGQLIGPELVQEKTEKIIQIKQRIQSARDQQKRDVCFGKRGKLNPRYVGPFKKCYADEPLAVLLDGLHFDNKIYLIEEPIEIMDREVKQLKQIYISIVKVRWNSRRVPEFMCEREDQFQKKDSGRLECRVSLMAPNVEDGDSNSRPDMSFDTPASLEFWWKLQT